jgi:TIR domain
MLWALSILLVIIFLLGLVSGYTLGNLIYLLLFLALALAIAARMKSKRSSGHNLQSVAGSTPASEPARSPNVLHPPQPETKPPRGAGARIFLSYRRDDSADVVGRIYDRLVKRFGADQVFKDVDSIRLGVDFREHLRAAVGECQVLLAVVGPSWAGVPDEHGLRRLDEDRDYVRVEIEAAFTRGIPVIPVLVRGAVLPSEEQLPMSLKPLAFRNGIAVRSDPDFHNDMDRLIAGLETMA